MDNGIQIFESQKNTPKNKTKKQNKTKQKTLECLDIEHMKGNLYRVLILFTIQLQSYGHVITGNVNIVYYDNVKSLILKGLKVMEARSFNWHSILYSVEECVIL